MIHSCTFTEFLLPICIELAADQKWDFFVSASIPSPEIRAATVILLLLKFLFPMFTPKNLDELVRAPKMELTQEEASLLFYLQNLPSYEKYMHGFNNFFGAKMKDPDNCFKDFCKTADHEIRSRTNPRNSNYFLLT